MKIFVKSDYEKCEQTKIGLDTALEKRDTFVLARMIAIEGVLVVETLPALHICREESENMCVRTWDSGVITGTIATHCRHAAAYTPYAVRKCRFSQSGFNRHTGFQTHTFHTFHASCTLITDDCIQRLKSGSTRLRWISEIPFGFRRNTRHLPPSVTTNFRRGPNEINEIRLRGGKGQKPWPLWEYFHRQDSITAAKIINFREIFPPTAVLSSKRTNSIRQILLYENSSF